MTSNFIKMAPLTALAVALAACGNNAANNSADAMALDNRAVSNSIADDMAMNMADPAGMTMPDAATFTNAAAASDAFELESSKLAQAKGSSQAVKDFAAEMIKAHTDSTAKLKTAAAAAQPAITPDPALNPNQQAKLDALKALSGDAFDKQYAADQVAQHDETLGALQSYASGGNVPSLKSFAAATAPVVSHHLSMARDLTK
jgi:putative membrane protein